MFIGWLSKVKLPFLGVRGQHKWRICLIL
jgi:hypothetical protein